MPVAREGGMHNQSIPPCGPADVSFGEPKIIQRSDKLSVADTRTSKAHVSRHVAFQRSGIGPSIPLSHLFQSSLAIGGRDGIEVRRELLSAYRCVADPWQS